MIPGTDTSAPEEAETPREPAPSAAGIEKAEKLETTVAPTPFVERKYPSLYDQTNTTILAIVLGIGIVGGVQFAIYRIYTLARNEHELLTRFVESLKALVVGASIADLLIAGPDTSMLSDDEHTIILGFIKDICLMVFAFYFGTKASASSPSSGASE